MSRAHRRPGRALGALATGLAAGVAMVAMVVALAACNGDDNTTPTTTGVPTETPTAAALTATIVAVVDELGDTEHERKVIVVPLYEGTGFDIQVQADVIANLAGIIDTQFIDDAEQALVDDGAAVVDDAILLRLAMNELPGPAAKVSGEIWNARDDIAEFSAEITWLDGAWVADVTIH